MDNRTLVRDSSYRMMALIHDNRLRHRFEDPIKTLNAAGMQPGQQVLEVGCGPGFFTIPAAQLVGDNGCVYAIDLVPAAIETVEKKLRKAGITNVHVKVADAANTGIPSNSIDLVFLFGVIHRLPLDRVLPELHRVLRPQGILSVQGGTSRSKGRIVNDGLFTFVGKEGGVSRFRKEAGLKNRL